MTAGILIKSALVNGDGSVDISFQKGTVPIDTASLVHTVHFPSKSIMKALYQELDDNLIPYLLVLSIALYVKKTGDNTLANVGNLAGHEIDFNSSNLTPISFT